MVHAATAIIICSNNNIEIVNFPAAVKAVVEAAGGTVNMVSFTRGAYDVVVDMNLPSQEMMMGAMATVEASGSMSETMYLECVDGDPIWDAARSIATAYKPANA